MRLITDGYADAHGIGGLAARLAVTQRHLHRLLVAELGAGPQALARTARLQTARRLLAETTMPVTEVAFASGFSSVRQFNASVRESSGRTPSELRARARRTGPGGQGTRDGADAPGTWLSLRLACREPFDAAGGIGFLAARAIPGVERVTPDRYARTVRTAAGPGIIELIPRPGQGHVLLRARLSGLGDLGPVVGGARRLLDADADPAAIGAALAADELIAPSWRRGPGSGCPAPTTASSWPSARSSASRSRSPRRARSRAGWPPGTASRCPPRASLTFRPGPARTRPPTRPPPRARTAGPPGLTVVFPGPEVLAGADLDGLGLTTARQRTLRALAAAAASGQLTLDPGADPGELAARLAGLPGIGPWTIGYILMRAAGDPDAFPAADLGLRRALARLGAPAGHDVSWRPWRAYAAMQLWTWPAQPDAARPSQTDPPRPARTDVARPAQPPVLVPAS